MHEPGRSKRGEPRYCEHPGSGAVTRENKPFCSEHVEEHPYVQDLLGRLAEREKEIQRIESRGLRAVDLQGQVVSEVLCCVREHGWITIARLRRETQFSDAVVSACVRALVTVKRIERANNHRGQTAVRILSA